jgi:hypothetical protein
MKAMGISTGSASKVLQDFIESGGRARERMAESGSESDSDSGSQSDSESIGCKTASKVLQDFIESGGKGSDGWLTRADVIERDAMGRPVVLDGVARMIKKARGFEKKWVKSHGQKVALEQVLVTVTRRCRQSGGGVPEDLRVLQPIEAFGDFGEDGRLKSSKVRDKDTPLQNKVKRARLTRIEVVAVVLYTGTLLASDSRECVLR